MLSLSGRMNHRAIGSASPPRIGGETDFRDVAHRSRLGSIVNSSVGGHSHMPSGYEPAVQLVLPYFGLFSYSIGRQSWSIDPSKILLVRPGWEYADGQPVKLTLTLPLRQASWLVEHARASGVSYGTYLASLVDGAPYPGSLAEAVRALMASTDQMASYSTDLRSFLGLIRGGRSAEAQRYREAVTWLFDEIRKHMKLSAALAAELRLVVRVRPTEESES